MASTVLGLVILVSVSAVAGLQQMNQFCVTNEDGEHNCADGLVCVFRRCRFSDCTAQAAYADKYGSGENLGLIGDLRTQAGQPLPHPKLPCKADGNYENKVCGKQGCICIGDRGAIWGKYPGKKDINCACSLDEKGRFCDKEGLYYPVQCDMRTIQDTLKYRCYCVETSDGAKTGEQETIPAQINKLPCYTSSQQWIQKIKEDPFDFTPNRQFSTEREKE